MGRQPQPKRKQPLPSLGPPKGIKSTIQYPIYLTPAKAYVQGVAALVFVNATTVSPADDLAEFGIYPLPLPEGEPPSKPHPFQFPNEGARVMAWLRPSELNRTYNLGFTCLGMKGNGFDLEASSGPTETFTVPGIDGTGSVLMPASVIPTEHDWLSFSLTSGGYWKFESLEISILP
jgi:hypothetical protein